jgi:pyruvate formate lyase activating enzyme
LYSRCLGLGVIFDIKRFAIHDGPGIRTTVFFKGCSLNCLWCHNPEGKATEKEFMWFQENCIHCRDCENLCPNGAISFPDDSIRIDKEKCELCGTCAENCYAQALTMVGRDVTVNQVIKELEKDTVFYDESGGGVTFSGGEPLLQPSFLKSLLTESKASGFHTVVDTCGYAEPRILLDASKFVDLFMYDIKVINNTKHLKYTGVSNELILNNLRRLSDEERQIIVRFVLIPSVNNTRQDILELGTFVSELKSVEEIHILPYHKGGVQKLKRLRKPLDFVSEPPSASVQAEAQTLLENLGLKVKIRG